MAAGEDEEEDDDFHPLTEILRQAQEAASASLNEQRGMEAAQPQLVEADEGLTPEAALLKRQVMDIYPDLPNWESLKIMGLPFCVNMVEDRIRLGRKSKTQKSSMADATKKWRFPAAIDDFLLQLHPARFLRAPLSDPKEYWRFLPTKRTSYVTTMPLRHLGISNSFAPVTIRRLHDRTNIINLKELLAANWSVESAAMVTKNQRADRVAGDGSDIGLVTELNYQEPENSRQIQEAMQSYIILMHHLFPFDYGPLLITTTLHKYQFFYSSLINRAEQILTLKLFINKALHTNATKAENMVPPLDVFELDEMAKEALRERSRPQVVPDFREVYSQTINYPPHPAGHVAHPMAPPPKTPSPRGRGRGRGAATSPPAPVWARSFKDEEVCLSWNKNKFCRRSKGASCQTEGGIILMHNCGLCGSSSHPQRDHV